MQSVKINPNNQLQLITTAINNNKSPKLQEKTQQCLRKSLTTNEGNKYANSNSQTPWETRKINYVSLEASLQQNKNKIQILGQKTYTDRLNTQKIGLLLEEIKQIFKKNQQISMKASPRSTLQSKENQQLNRQSVEKNCSTGQNFKTNKQNTINQRKSEGTNKIRYLQIDYALLMKIQSALLECKREKQQNKKSYIAILDKYERTVQERNRTISSLIENIRTLEKKIQFSQLAKTKNLNLQKTHLKKSQQEYSKVIRRKLLNEIIESNKQANLNLHQNRQKNCDQLFQKSMKSSFYKSKSAKKYPFTNNQKQNLPIKLNKCEVFELKISKYKLKNADQQQKTQKIENNNDARNVQ